jgi:TonB-linked SusC/RagA family outer membrane protein
MIPIYNADGSYGDWNPIWYSGNYINTPVALVNLEKDNSKFSTLLPDFFVSWELLPGLTLRSTFSYKDRNTYRYKYFPGTLPASEAKQQGGYAYQYSGPSDEILNNNLISYRHVWKNAHSLSVMAGWIYEKDENRNFIATGTGYFVDGMEENSLQSAPSKDQTSISSANSSQTIISALSRINYNYKQKYYLTLTGRADGSSNFSVNHKWAFFPSGAVKWRIAQENFMKSIRSINNLDLRLSYGVTGNQAISPYQSLPKLAVNNNGYIFGGQIPVAYYPSSLPNTNLTWETSREADLGLDVAAFGDRIHFTTDAYYTRTTNLLLNIQIPQQTGYVSRLVNLGTTMNKGIEFTLNTTNIQTPNFSWASIVTFARDWQKVLNLGPLVQVETHDNYTASQYPMYAYQVGLPTSSVFGAVYAGTWKSDADITANKNKYVSIPTFYHPGRPRYIDQNHDGVLDKNDIVYLGQADPKYYGGLDNDFTYKGFELDVYFEYSGGNVMYNDVELEMASGSSLTNQFAYMLDGWNAKTNPESNIPAPGSYDHVPNTRYVHNASYIRLISARLGYNFDPQKWGIKGITHASFFISGLNLLLWTKYTGYDPEVNTEGTSSTVRRNDDGAYPPNRTIAANLSLTF